MRAVLILLLLATGCGAGSKSKSSGGGGGGSRPAVIPMLSELPGDPEKRDGILNSANQVAGPEHRKGFTKKERKAETAAATAAAIIGGIFSKSSNVTIGTATSFDENEIIAPQTVKKQPRSPNSPGGEGGEGDPEKQKDGDKPPAPLVPWIKLK